MRCAACDTDNPPGAKFCTSCGAGLARACPGCGQLNSAAGRFCAECGAASSASPAPASKYQAPRSYTPRELQEKILANQATIEGQRKQVTVLSADIAGFAPLAERLDPEDTHEIATRCFDLLLEHVHRYEGHVAQFTGDGMVALFGAPIAHEDHAQRAARAALNAQQPLAGYRDELRGRGADLRVRIGLNSGAVVVGTVGTDLNVTCTASSDRRRRPRACACTSGRFCITSGRCRTTRAPVVCVCHSIARRRHAPRASARRSRAV